MKAISIKGRKKVIELQCSKSDTIIAETQLDKVKYNHINMELTIDEKRKVIDDVQQRINKWIGRSKMTFHEAVFLHGKHYPFKIQVDLPFPALMISQIEQTEIKYSELLQLIRSTDVEKEEESLFRYAVENFLTYCFGG